jgi:hypothetical protein
MEAKWLEAGGLQGLGAVTIPEQPAAISPFGTTGMYAAFTRGHINWSGKHGTFVLYGAIDGQYTQIGGSGSRIGFPTSDEYDWSNGRRQDFEVGYIYWDRPSNQTRVWPGAATGERPGPVGPAASSSQELIDAINGADAVCELIGRASCGLAGRLLTVLSWGHFGFEVGGLAAAMTEWDGAIRQHGERSPQVQRAREAAARQFGAAARSVPGLGPILEIFFPREAS